MLGVRCEVLGVIMRRYFDVFHECYDRGGNFWIQQFLNDGAPEPKIAGMLFLFIATSLFLCLRLWVGSSDCACSLFRSIYG